MIKTFDVGGFKTLYETKVELGLVNVFIGPNGSGKSNLLESFGVVGAAVSGSVEPETLRYRGVRNGNSRSYKGSFNSKSPGGPYFEVRSDDIEYVLNFENLESHQTFRWKIKDEILIHRGRVLLRTIAGGCEISIQGSNPQRIMSSPDHSAAMLAVRIQKDGDLAVQDLLERLENYAIYTPTTPILRGTTSEAIIRNPLGLGGSGIDQAIDEMLRGEPDKLGPFELDEVYELIDWAESLQTEYYPGSDSRVAGGLVRLRIVDRFMRETDNSVTLLEASEGALYVLGS